MMTVAGTCVAVDEIGVLLRGSSGSGKSDLALRLITQGACLIADDLVQITPIGTTFFAQAVSGFAGLIEVRGLGIVSVPSTSDKAIGLIVDLVAPEDVPRLPEESWTKFYDRRVPFLQCAAFHISTPIKIRLAISCLKCHGSIDPSHLLKLPWNFS